MIISSANRRVHFTETPDGNEADLNTLLGELSPHDVVLVEGFKQIDFPKMEIYRASLGNPPLYLSRPGIRLVATDEPISDCPHPQVDLNNAEAVVDAIFSHWGQ